MPLPKKLTARAKEARIDETHRCPRDRTALLVVDMQHGFLDPGASLEVPKGRAIIPRLRRLVAAWFASYLSEHVSEMLGSNWTATGPRSQHSRNPVTGLLRPGTGRGPEAFSKHALDDSVA